MVHEGNFYEYKNVKPSNGYSVVVIYVKTKELLKGPVSFDMLKSNIYETVLTVQMIYNYICKNVISFL